jgi:hypothetical protein
MVSMSSDVNGPRTHRARVILLWKAMGRVAGLLPLIPVPFFFENLEAAAFLGGDLVPRDAEVRHVEFEFQDPLEQGAGRGAPAHVVEVIQFAVPAPLHRELPGTAVRARARCVRIIHLTHQAAFAADDIVGIRAAARAVRAAIAQLRDAQQP